MKRGKFIVFEGGEGAGKGAVSAFLESEFPAAFFTREPGGTELGERIRADMISKEAADASAETQFCLVWASRFDHVTHKIRPALEAGTTLISERFDASTYAYQIHGQQAHHLKPLFYEFRKFLGSTVPDFYIFLDVDVQAGLARSALNRKRRELLDHFERRSLDFHERVREGYVEFFKTVPHVVVDADRPLKDVQQEVSALVRKYIRS